MKWGTDALRGVKNTLTANGCRWTRPRRGVLAVFSRSAVPLTPGEVYGRLKGQGINLASVYRTINLFYRMGTLVLVDGARNGRRYELSEKYRAHHAHLICNDCGRVEDFEGCHVKGFDGRVLRKSRFRVVRHELRFFGVCAGCCS